MLFSSRDYSSAKNLVKPRAFLPVRDPETGVLETSATDTEGLDDAQTWAHLEVHVADTRPPPSRMHGRADFSHDAAVGAGIDLRYDEGEARHVGIVGWPNEKESQKAIAVELAGAARLLLR